MSQIETTTSAIVECLTNIELVKNICKYLNFEDQLQLMQASKELRHIIVDFVWKEKFKEVEIYIIDEKTFFVSDKINTEPRLTINVHFSNFRNICEQSNILFQRNALNSFMNLNARNFKKLHFKYYGNQRRNIRIFPLLKQNFINLTYLRFERATLTHKDIQKVAKNCLKLETLVFFNCFQKDNQALILDDTHIEIIKKMQNLKNLRVTLLPSRFRQLHSFSNVRKILDELKLQQVKLSFICKPDTCTNENNSNFSFNNLKYCKIFEIGTCKKLTDFINFQFNILPKFENLCNFTLNSALITEKFFDILSKTCTNLTYLSLIFCRIKCFKAVPKLQELILYCCRHMTLLNLKTILNEMQLKSFRTHKTCYKGDLELFHISPTLERLHCDFTQEKLVELLKFNNKNLKNMSHIKWEMFSLGDFSLSLSDFAPNLKVLHVHRLHLSVVDCYQIILKHKNLNELTIEGSTFSNSHVDPSEIKSFKTNLSYLNISGEALFMLQDFCLDLLQLNSKLSLTCFNITTDIILKVINNENFPCRFKSIKICGFLMDCISIQNNNSKEAVAFVQLLVNAFETLNEKCYFALE